MLARVIGTIVIILVLYAIITDPQDSAASVRSGVSTAGDAGSSITVFLSSLVADLEAATVSGTSRSGTSGSDIGDPVYPRNGVETGDGSTRSAG